MFQVFISEFTHPLERDMLAEPPCPNVHLLPPPPHPRLVNGVDTSVPLYHTISSRKHIIYGSTCLRNGKTGLVHEQKAETGLSIAQPSGRRILGKPGRKSDAFSSLLEHHVSQKAIRFRSWALIGRGNYHRL